MFINLILSGPSVIAPSARSAEYLNFQFSLYRLAETNAITGSVILFPITNAIAARQQPEDRATPSSSSSSSSSSILTL